jgi:hypothetical protein
MSDTDNSDLIPSTRLEWRRTGGEWRLFSGRRCFGRVVPESQHPGMWRSILPSGRLSDVANLSWARNAVLEVARRELAYEQRARHPQKAQQKRAVLDDISSGTAILTPDRLPGLLSPGGATASL